MSPPDLTTEEANAAYRAELRAVARTPRLVGFGLILAGAVAVFLAGRGGGETATLAGYVLLAAGWACFGYAILRRSQYHRRRMEALSAQLGGESQ